MNIALIDSGFGSLPTAAHLRRMRAAVDLHLYLDPDDAPWGPKPPEWTRARVVDTARRAVDEGAHVVVLPCNTASVIALDAVRAALADVPVVGTVPAIKPAAREHDVIAIWSTAATAASAYQARLVREFAVSATVVPIACHGLADAIDRGDVDAITAAIDSAAQRTPGDVEAIVMGCTHYPLVAEEIMARFGPEVRMYDSAEAVAAQTLRRLDEATVASGFPYYPGSGSLAVTLSGRPGVLPDSALRFPAGRALVADVLRR